MSKRLLLNGFLVVVVIAIAVGVFATVHSSKGSAATTTTLAAAKRGNVLQSVTSTGNVEAPTDLSLSFQESGEVTHIYVAPGDQVRAGQALAQVDDTEPRIALVSAESSLTSAQANLAALRRGETPIEREADSMSAVAAAQGVTAAQQGLAQAQQNAASNVTKYQQAIEQAQSSLTAANAGVTSAENGVHQAEVTLATLQATADHGAPSANESLDATITRYTIDQTTCTNNATVGGVECNQINNLLTLAKGVQTAQTGLTQAQAQQSSASDGVSAAEQGRTSGELQDQQGIQNAQTQLTSAQTQYQSALVNNAVKEEPPKPEQIAQAQSAIVSAQSQVVSAKKNESETVLRAPAGGVVAAVNGTVGQQSGSSGSSAASSTSAASSSSSGSSSGSGSSSSSGFIELTNVKLLDVSVGFPESDAPKVHVGQAATVTLDALPNQTFSGHVIELDTDSTLVSNVVTYYAKVAFDTVPAGVKPGMTATVNVVLDTRDNVITLPTSAVSTTGTSESVTVRPAHGAETTRTITIGLRGDNAVEISSGLSVGDQVVLTNAASTGTGSFLGGGGGLGGGLGGGTLRVGGGGGGRGG